jgi:hypothetical protein
VKILGPDGAELPPGAEGEIYTRHLHVTAQLTAGIDRGMPMVTARPGRGPGAGQRGCGTIRM